MEEGEVRLSWRAALVPARNGSPVFGKLNKVEQGKVTLGVDLNLAPGQRCDVVIAPPRLSLDKPEQYIEGDGVVTASVLSGAQFQITLRWDPAGSRAEKMLHDHVRMHGKVWRKPL